MHTVKPRIWNTEHSYQPRCNQSQCTAKISGCGGCVLLRIKVVAGLQDRIGLTDEILKLGQQLLDSREECALLRSKRIVTFQKYVECKRKLRKFESQALIRFEQWLQCEPKLQQRMGSKRRLKIKWKGKGVRGSGKMGKHPRKIKWIAKRKNK